VGITGEARNTATPDAHRSIETTMEFYVAQNSDDVADERWAEYGANSRNKAS
jgi:hypothetical protein